jgi:hypothetical protein
VLSVGGAQPSAVLHRAGIDVLMRVIRRLAGSFRRLLTERRHLAPGLAVAAIDADRDIAGDGGAAHDAALIAVIVDRDMLGGAVVPDRDIARLLAPAHGIFQSRHMALQQVEEMR